MDVENNKRQRCAADYADFSASRHRLHRSIKWRLHDKLVMAVMASSRSEKCTYILTLSLEIDKQA